MDEASPGADDLHDAVRLCQDTLVPVAGENWDVQTAGLEWTARALLVHLVNVPLFYAEHLAHGADGPRRMDRPDYPDATIPELLAILARTAGTLAEVVRSAPAGARGWHPAGMADRAGFAAMGCDEILIHTDDLARTFRVPFIPPEHLCRTVLRRLFPWAPTDVDPWSALRWANGRQDVAGRSSPGASWAWHCAPLSEWDGTVPVWPV